MFLSSWRRFLKRSSSPSRQGRRPRAPRPRCEELEPRLQPSAFVFSTGLPDGKIATISEPANAHNGRVEFESADDFVLNTETEIRHASFIGLLTGGAKLSDLRNVVAEFYHVFPKDSDVGRTSGPPTFSTSQVPTRVNSPSDVAFDSRDSAAGELSFEARVLDKAFTVQNAVSSTDKIAVNSGGDGPVAGKEVEIAVTFRAPIDLPADHYFFVPQVGLKKDAPAGADFLWLSAPKPIQPPGTPFPAGVTDLQSWMRDDPPLAPDWLRIGKDIIGGTAFNASFALSGNTVRPHLTSLSQTSAPEGSPDLTITLDGTNFTSQSTVLLNGLQPLATRFVNSGQLQAIIPALFLAEEGSFKLSVLDAQNGLSNAKRFTVTDGVPQVSATVAPGSAPGDVTLSGLVQDLASEHHRVRIRWGGDQVETIDLGVGTGGSFSVTHHFKHSPAHHTIVVTALDDAGTASAPLTLDITV